VRMFCAAMDTQCRWCDHPGGAAVCFQRLVTPPAPCGCGYLLSDAPRKQTLREPVDRMTYELETHSARIKSGSFQRAPAPSHTTSPSSNYAFHRHLPRRRRARRRRRCRPPRRALRADRPLPVQGQVGLRVLLSTKVRVCLRCTWSGG
jgi:hypothetical protein